MRKAELMSRNSYFADIAVFFYAKRQASRHSSRFHRPIQMTINRCQK